MDDSQMGQVSTAAAEVYEAFFVPALFGQWAAQLLELAAPPAGGSLLDVACGTGVLARAAAARLGAGARIVGLDRNRGMLAVAARAAPALEWRFGLAEELPFAEASFDAVACQFGLMFFEDRVRALKEMRRVLRPGGRLAFAVWDRLATTPGYAAMVALLDRLFGRAAADALRAPFCLGETQDLRGLLDRAGLGAARIETLPGEARFPSLDAWVETDVKGWTLAETIDEAQYARLQDAAAEALAGFVARDGSVRFAAPAHLAVAVKD